MTEDHKTLEARLDRMESIAAIRQLAFKYAVAVDMRDMDAIVNLYVTDAKVSEHARGRQALKRVFAEVLRTFTSSVHHVGNHIVEFDDADNAHGLVYCRCEHEIGAVWLPMYLYYLDIYKRVDGIWYIKRRAPCELYGVATTDAPVGPDKVRWPGRPPHDGTWHKHFPSWQEYWASAAPGEDPVKPEAPPDKFLDTMRRGERRVFPMNFDWAKNQAR